MKRLLALMLCAVSLGAAAQITYPYNPDFENDGSVGIEDLLELLAVYGLSFQPNPILLDGVEIENWLYQQTAILLEQQQVQDSLGQMLTQLSARVDSLEALVSAIDVQEGGSNDSSVALELSLVQTGVAPLCSAGSGIYGEESSNNYSYSLSTCGSSNVTLDFVTANWRKFSLSSEMNLSDTLNILMKIDQYNTYDGGSWSIQTVPVELVRNESGTYDFVLYATGGSGNSQCCTADWDVNSYFAEPALQAQNYWSGCYCYWTWRHIEIWYEMDGFLLDSGIRFGIQ